MTTIPLSLSSSCWAVVPQDKVWLSQENCTNSHIMDGGMKEQNTFMGQVEALTDTAKAWSATWDHGGNCSCTRSHKAPLTHDWSNKVTVSYLLSKSRWSKRERLPCTLFFSGRNEATLHSKPLNYCHRPPEGKLVLEFQSTNPAATRTAKRDNQGSYKCNPQPLWVKQAWISHARTHAHTIKHLPCILLLSFGH